MWGAVDCEGWYWPTGDHSSPRGGIDARMLRVASVKEECSVLWREGSQQVACVGSRYQGGGGGGGKGVCLTTPSFSLRLVFV